MKNCCDKKIFPDHSNEIQRLNKISGQIEGVKKMIQDRRYCPDIIIQLKAISSAVKSVESIILKSHLESCIKDAFSTNNLIEQQAKIDELIKLFQK